MCALVFLLLISAGLCHAADYNILHFDHELARKHELWMAEHGRVYEDEAEQARRLEIFKDNLKYIEDFNSGGEHGYTLGLNQFADLTNEEFRSMYGGGLEIRPDGGDQDHYFEDSLSRSFNYEISTAEPLNVSVPNEIDWRANGAVTRVMNQGKCQSCWALATVATVEGLVKIKKNKLYKLSEQQLIDCDKYNGGCNRGHMSKAYKYIIENGGITTESNYPFTAGRKEACKKKEEKQVVVTIRGYGSVRRNNEDRLMQRVTSQPVAVGIDSTQRNFQLYKKGIYEGPCSSTEIDHAVTVVGYGVSGSKRYWIVKNSWGEKWGEGGYVRMKMGVGREGICGITQSAWYPTM